ncbi:site-2 protease family protein [Planctomycetota bacterium]
MLLSEPQPVQGDIRFSVTNVPVRISIWAWPLYAFLGWDLINLFPDNGTYKLMRLAMWTSAVAVSILLHELGHAWMFRRFGISARIVLHHMGGVAIPDGPSSYREIDSKEHIMVSAAGPAIQLVLAGSVFLIGKVINPDWMPSNPGVMTEPDRFPFLASMLHDLFRINLWWALFNLLPIYPLDGGQIAREVFLMRNSTTGIRNSLMLSVATAVLTAVIVMQGSQLMGIMVLLFAFNSYQTLQQYTGGGSGGGGYGGGGYGGGNNWR